MPPIYDIEQTKAVFDRVLQTKVTVSVSELCFLSSDIHNQFWTAVTPKQNVPSNVAMLLESSNPDPFDNALLTFAFDYDETFS